MTNGTNGTKGHRNLLVWQRTRDRELIKLIYQITSKFPSSETFGLTSQMRRAAVSVAANIVEGYSRKRQSPKESLQFFSIAEGSLAELEALLEIASDVIKELSIENYKKTEK